MSALGQKQTFAVQKVMSALPPKAVEIADIVCRWRAEHFWHLQVPSNVDLLRYGENIVHINAEIPHSALYLSVTKQKLDGALISGAPIDECRLEEHASCEAMSAFGRNQG